MNRAKFYGAQRMTWKEAVTHYAGNVMRSAS